MAFNFPDPSGGTTKVTNTETGISYVWLDPPGKWVVDGESYASVAGNAVWEGDAPPDPIGDYKLWYSTDTLELYFHYCDINGSCAWVPTSAPITMLDSLIDEVSATGAEIATVKRNIVEIEDDIANVVGSLGQVDLEEVLTNDNVADKGFVLTNLENDAILVSPEQARIMVGGVGESVIPKFELRHTTGAHDTSLVALEIDQDGARFDIECDEKVDNIHFRFEDDVKFELNKKGDAVFNGKVKVTEATENDEVPTLGQVTAVTDLLQLELDQLTGSYEGGAWNHDNGDGITDGTEYVLKGVQTEESFNKAKEPLLEALNQCLTDSEDDIPAMTQCNRDYDDAVNALPKVGTTYNTNDWNIVNKVIFSAYDLDGNNHSFKDVEPGQTLDMYCDDGSGFMVARINKVTAGMWYEDKTLEITPLKTNGVANGKTRVKIFTLDDTVDADALDAYLKKAGDKMTGMLEISAGAYNKAIVVNGADADNPALSVWNSGGIATTYKDFKDNELITKEYSDKKVLKTGDTMTGALIVEPDSGNTTLRIQGSPTSSDNQNILNVYSNKGSQVFWVDSKHAGLTGSAKTPTNDSHLVTKKYVDDRRGYGVPYKYRFADQRAENLATGEFFIADNNSIYCARYNAESKDMSISSEYITDQNRYGLLKIYAANGNLLHMIEYKELRLGQGANNYIRWLYVEKLKSYSSWMESETYYLADGLLLPY